MIKQVKRKLARYDLCQLAVLVYCSSLVCTEVSGPTPTTARLSLSGPLQSGLLSCHYYAPSCPAQCGPSSCSSSPPSTPPAWAR